MRTDLTDEEHRLLYEISKIDVQGFYWLARDETEETNACLADLIYRGLLRRENEWFIRITDEGALLARMYGEP